jgi:mono/diheme cytochrome c family protein
LLARGAYLADTTCVACHSTAGTLPLSGGNDMLSDVDLPLGTLVPPNLTPGGPLSDWSDEQIVQSIRNGISSNGRVLMKPTRSLRNLSDSDLAALTTYLRSQPSVQHATPPVNASPLLAFFFGAGLAPLGEPPVTGSVIAPPPAPNAAYGAYIVSYHDCRVCHGANLQGVAGSRLAEPAPSARTSVMTWSEAEFIAAMRTGITPNGRVIQPSMPWEMIGRMSDNDLAAMYHYLRSGE